MSASIETNGADVENGIGHPVVANDKTQEVAPVVGRKQKQGRFAKFTNRQTCFDIVRFLLFLLTLIALVVMAFQISRDQNAIQKLNNELDNVAQLKNMTGHELRSARDISYMDGFSGMIEEDDTVSLIDRAVMITGVTSTTTSIVNATSTVDTCDDETDVPEATSMPFVNVTLASTNVTTTIPVTTTTAQAFLNTTVTGFFNTTSSTANVTFIASVNALSASITSMTVTSSSTETTTVSSTSTETCGEWGDGAGPCDRPYGAPNTQPGSTSSTYVMSMSMSMSSTLSVAVVSVTPVASLMISQESTAVTAAGFSSAMSVDAISASASSVGSTTTTTTTTSSSSSSIIDSAVVCAPTATVYVTITASAVEDAPGITTQSANSSVSTTTTTSTSLATTLTETLPGSNGPEVVTETLSVAANSTATWANSSSSTTTTTASFTVTFTPAHSGNTTYTGGSSGSTPAAGVSTIPLMSGGDKAFGKPMGANGNTSGTGNGLYCVVMLVSLVALLI